MLHLPGGLGLTYAWCENAMIRGPDLNIFDQLHLATKINIRYTKFSTTQFRIFDCIRATVIPGPLNKASFWCQLDPSQKCHRMTPSTAGWLKNMVSRFSRAAAFLCSSAASTVSSVAQIFKPASATLSSLYCDDTKVHNQSKMALNIKCQNRSQFFLMKLGLVKIVKIKS